VASQSNQRQIIPDPASFAELLADEKDDLKIDILLSINYIPPYVFPLAFT